MHMECEDLIRLISEYLDDEMEDLMRDEFREHIYRCERCTAILRTTKQTIVFVQEIHKEEKVPATLMRKVYYEIKIRSKK